MNDTVAQFKAQWKTIADRIDDLSLRERALVFLALMGVLYTGASTLLFAPLHAQRTQLERQLGEQRTQIAQFDEQVQTLAATGGRGTTEQRARLTALQQEQAQLDAALGDMTRRLVSPKEMAKLVEQMLARNGRLQLIKVENLAPTPLFGDAKATPTAGMLYKHGMRVQFKGEYGDIVNYLRAVEQLPWRMFWGEVSLAAAEPPVSTVTIVIYTISTREGWIGV